MTLNLRPDRSHFSKGYRRWHDISIGASTNAILKSWVDAHIKFLN